MIKSEDYITYHMECLASLWTRKRQIITCSHLWHPYFVDSISVCVYGTSILIRQPWSWRISGEERRHEAGIQPE
jgi:hypothetical protein